MKCLTALVPAEKKKKIHQCNIKWTMPGLKARLVCRACWILTINTFFFLPRATFLANDKTISELPNCIFHLILMLKSLDMTKFGLSMEYENNKNSRLSCHFFLSANSIILSNLNNYKLHRADKVHTGKSTRYLLHLWSVQALKAHSWTSNFVHSSHL